jgi:hypothetical protein
MFYQFILDALQTVSPDRLQRAVCGLADNTYHVDPAQCDTDHVSGTVMNGDGKEYAVSIGDGEVSCECPDFSYRKVTCKHLLAIVLRVLSVEERRKSP